MRGGHGHKKSVYYMTSHYALTVGRFVNDDPAPKPTVKHNKTVKNGRVKSAMDRIHNQPPSEDDQQLMFPEYPAPSRNHEYTDPTSVRKPGDDSGPTMRSSLAPTPFSADQDPSKAMEYYKNLEPVPDDPVYQTDQQLVLTKLKYITRLLEEQRRERTHHVSEELAMYSFLGVFMIFIVDSFTKVGRYARLP